MVAHLNSPHPAHSIPSSSLIIDLLIRAMNKIDRREHEVFQYIESALVLALGPNEQDQRKAGGLTLFRVNQVRKYVREHLPETILLDDVAALSRLSRSHFSRAFKASFGEPFTRYIMRCRIELAQLQIASTDLPLCMIAADCGLSDQAHLTRLFHKFVGTTPAAWRRHMKTFDSYARTAA